MPSLANFVREMMDEEATGRPCALQIGERVRMLNDAQLTGMKSYLEKTLVHSEGALLVEGQRNVLNEVDCEYRKRKEIWDAIEKEKNARKKAADKKLAAEKSRQAAIAKVHDMIEFKCLTRATDEVQQEEFRRQHLAKMALINRLEIARVRRNKLWTLAAVLFAFAIVLPNAIPCCLSDPAFHGVYLPLALAGSAVLCAFVGWRLTVLRLKVMPQSTIDSAIFLRRDELMRVEMETAAAGFRRERIILRREKRERKDRQMVRRAKREADKKAEIDAIKDARSEAEERELMAQADIESTTTTKEAPRMLSKPSSPGFPFGKDALKSLSRATASAEKEPPAARAGPPVEAKPPAANSDDIEAVAMSNPLAVEEKETSRSSPGTAWAPSVLDERSELASVEESCASREDRTTASAQTGQTAWIARQSDDAESPPQPQAAFTSPFATSPCSFKAFEDESSIETEMTVPNERAHLYLAAEDDEKSLEFEDV